MTGLPDYNIVVQALLNVLAPSAEQLDASKKNLVSRRAAHRGSAGSRAIGTHRHSVARPANVEIVTRISATAISVSWSDPCLGRCTEQIWGRAFATAAAVCALTGRQIRRGEPVYRPHARDARVLPNRELAILAAMIKQASASSRAGT
ncbi:DUF3331 domain-containing protein [Burkholderia territorii]|uniref:DUF3331 domain-containing protein n=1 Tax=Burkholderia territorii TaxID=1503055 RepID=UPI0009BE2F81|nr:DUF3331 domain-containing protein [Burkholderia territorii]